MGATEAGHPSIELCKSDSLGNQARVGDRVPLNLGFPGGSVCQGSFSFNNTLHPTHFIRWKLLSVPGFISLTHRVNGNRWISLQQAVSPGEYKVYSPQRTHGPWSTEQWCSVPQGSASQDWSGIAALSHCGDSSMRTRIPACMCAHRTCEIVAILNKGQDASLS